MNPGNHKDFIFLVSLGPILFPGSLRTSKEISNPFKMSPLRLRHERDVDSQAWKTRNRKTYILKCTDCKSRNWLDIRQRLRTNLFWGYSLHAVYLLIMLENHSVKKENDLYLSDKIETNDRSLGTGNSASNHVH